MPEKKVIIVMGNPEGKKHSIRYNALPSVVDPAITAVYIMRTALRELDFPKKVKITIEPADE